MLAWKLNGGQWCAWLAFCTLAGALCIQIATNFFNDAIDSAKGADTDKRLGPTRVTASGLLSHKVVTSAGVLFLLLAAAFGAVLIKAAGWPILAIGVVSMFFAYGYTGGPLPLAYRGLGELFVFLFFGLIAVSGTVFVQMGEWRTEALLLGSQIGLLSCVLISINNLRDREEDSSTGKRTLAVRLGPKPARLMLIAEIKVAALLGIVWILLGQFWLALAVLPILSIGMRLTWGALTEPEGSGMNRMLAMSGVQLMAFAALFHVLAVIPS